LRTIEINGTFYALQTPARYAAWRAAVPDDFVFSVKAPRYLTHVLRLADFGHASAGFFASGLFALGAALGPILWQLPPWLPFDPDRIEPFLATLPRDTAEALEIARASTSRSASRPTLLEVDTVRPLRHALEVRHESFADPAFVRLLRDYGVALVVADTGGRWPELHDVTADFLYLRLHGAIADGTGYDAAALDAWAARIDAWAQGREPADPGAARRLLGAAAPSDTPRDVFCTFDNTDKVHAPDHAVQLQRRVDAAAAR
jgi:uncharacterized protein YecE (DUF72 family)